MRYACLLVSALISTAVGCGTPTSSVQFHDWSARGRTDAPIAQTVEREHTLIANGASVQDELTQTND